MRKVNTDNSKKLKVLVINYEFPPLGGGGGVASYDLAVEWAKDSQVDVLTSSFKDLPKEDKVDNINIYRSKVLFRKSRDAASFISMLTYLISGFFKGYRLIRKNRYDVINTHFAIPSGPLGFIFGKMFKIPNVLSIHGGDIYDPSKRLSPHRNFIFKRIVKFILNKADRIVAQSQNTRENAIKYYSPKHKIDVVPLAIHPLDIPKPKRKDFGLKNSDFVMCMVGRIVRRKSLDTVIRAIKKLNDKRFKFFIMGDGPEKRNLELLVEELGLEDSVKFLGFVSVEEKYSYLHLSDLFVLTSLHEGFGIVYLEAMYCSLPIVCADHGGQTDFLSHEENALLIEVGDVDACVESIRRYSDDKKLYKKCAKNNKEQVVNFYAENLAAQYQQFFCELIGAKSE